MEQSDTALRRVFDAGILSGQVRQLAAMQLEMGSGPQPDEMVAGLCFMVGIQASAAGAFDHATNLHECSIAEGRRSSDVYYNLGNALMAQEQFEKAEAAYGQALEYESDNAYIFFNRGLARLRRDQDDIEDLLVDFVAAGKLDCDLAGFGKVICDLGQLGLGFVRVLEILKNAGLGPTSEALLRDELDSRISSDSYLLADLTNRRGRDADAWMSTRCALADALMVPRKAPGDRLRDLLATVELLQPESDWIDLCWRLHYVIGVIANAGTMIHYQAKDLPIDTAIIVTIFADPDDTAQPVLRDYVAANPGLGLDSRQANWRDHLALKHYFSAARLVMTECRMAADAGPINIHRLWYLYEDLYRETARACVALDETMKLVHIGEMARAAFQVLCAPSLPYDVRARFIAHAQLVDSDYEAATFDLDNSDLFLVYLTSELVEDRLDVAAIAGSEIRCVEQAASIMPFRDRESERSVLDALLVTNEFWVSPKARLAKLAEAIGVESAAALAIVERAEYGIEPKTDDPMYADVENSLFKELEDLVPRAARLTVVPYNYLHNLPFALLPALKKRILDGELRALTYAPSAMAFRAAQRLPASARRMCLFVGYTDFDDLQISGELEVVKRYFEHTTQLLGSDATVAKLRAELANHDVVHFCCHGLHDADKDEPYLALCDDRLFPEDILRHAGSVPGLIVANACISAVSPRKSNNGDASITLSSSWLLAGAKNVIGSHWRIHDEVAVEMCDAFYKHYHAAIDVPAGEALLSAQRQIAQSHPADALWAPYVCHGASN